MKKQLLKLFSTFLIFNSAFLISVNAQIIYTDVVPDVITTCTIPPYTFGACGTAINLDLNNDGTSDFSFTYNKSIWHIGGGVPIVGRSSSLKVNPSYGNAVASLVDSALKLNLNDSISGTADTWNPSINNLLCSYYFIPTHWKGYWHYATNNYLALKLQVGANIYYGWVRLDVTVWSTGIESFTIKDYAYNSVPNQPILAGACPTPTATLSPGGSLSICQGDNVTLAANGTGTQYQWKKNGVNISGAIQQTYIAKTAGIYNVIVTNGCGSSQASNSVVVTVTLPCKNSDGSLSDNNDALEHLSVYPNPATNSVTIKIHSDEAGEIQIINLFGRVVETHNYASLRDGELQIDVAKFPAGMYVVRWSSGENYETKTFSVIK